MKEYIERSAFKNNLMAAMINKTAGGDALAMKIGMLMCNLADCEPAADVAPVVHGEWVFIDHDETGYQVQCSHCKTVFVFPSKDRRTKHCPECGAKMDGGNHA